MIKKHKIPNQLIADFDFWISDLSVSFVSDFELRISDFDSIRLGAMKTVSASRETNDQKI
jgi:hypothetical protein